MICQQHDLPGLVPGTRHTFDSYHFGQDGSGPHVYLQAGLHADELPGVLLLHRLRRELAVLEQGGRVAGRITLVPMCNPLGMAQHWQGQHHGRFETGSGENFNRHYPDLSERAAQLCREGRLAPRAALRQALAELPQCTALDGLRRVLTDMALQADMVLDVHCDSEAVLHLYGNHRHAAEAAVLAGFMQAGATLLCDEAGGMSFDDAVVQNWLRLERQLAQPLPVPFAATLELRGVADVDDRLAARDGDSLLAWLTAQGVLTGEPLPAPQPPNPPTPLEGVACIVAPHGGVLVYQVPYGQWLRAGTLVAYVLDPHSGERTPLLASHDGYYYARVAGRLVCAGAEVAYIATPYALRQGHLLSA